MKATGLDELRHHFRPEFLNRVDEIIVFHALSEAHLMQIVEIQLDRVRQQLAERKIHLQLTPEARTHLVHTGYDPHYGARPLKRAIQREIETLLGVQLLKGAVHDGQTVVADYDPASGALTFTPQTLDVEEEEAVAAREKLSVGVVGLQEESPYASPRCALLRFQRSLKAGSHYSYLTGDTARYAPALAAGWRGRAILPGCAQLCVFYRGPHRVDSGVSRHGSTRE